MTASNFVVHVRHLEYAMPFASAIPSKTALLNWTTGQDGSYLVEILLEKGDVVQGITRGPAANQMAPLKTT